jgi:N-acetylmuramoyl-L-alanine amidase
MRWIEAALAVTALTGLAGGAAQISRPGAPRAPAAMPEPAQPATPPRFAVVLDAAHGGSDDGARLGNGVLEKNLTLALAERLQTMLRNQGAAVVMLRTTDADVPALNRAEIANHAQAAACLVIHATATGSGVHLFASSLSPREASVAGTPAMSPAAATQILPWQTAQAAYVTQSLKLEAEIDEALARAEIPVTMGRASVGPMDSLACPAVAVELAPLAPGEATKGRAITDERYQKTVEGALAAAIGEWRTDRAEP